MQSDQMRHFNRIAKQYQNHCADILIEKRRYEIINKKLFKNFKNIHSFKSKFKRRLMCKFFYFSQKQRQVCKKN